MFIIVSIQKFFKPLLRFDGDAHGCAVVFTPGGQLNYNIWVVVRELLNGDDSKVKAVRDTGDLNAIEDAEAVIIGGGPYSVYRRSISRIVRGFVEKILEQGESGKPLLGICLGHQLIAKHFDGKIKKGVSGEYSYTDVELDTGSILFKGIPRSIRVWSSHRDEVSKMPNGFKVTAFSRMCRVEAMEHETKPIYSVQFHPEVYETEQGSRIILNFLRVAGIMDACQYDEKYSKAFSMLAEKPGREPVLQTWLEPRPYERVKHGKKNV